MLSAAGKDSPPVGRRAGSVQALDTVLGQLGQWTLRSPLISHTIVPQLDAMPARAKSWGHEGKRQNLRKKNNNQGAWGGSVG